MTFKKLAVLIGALGILPGLSSGQEWTRFRGPNGTGLSDASLPVQWKEEDIKWKSTIPGVGHSSPVLWGEKLFLTSADRKTGERLLLCLDATTGKTLWTKAITGKSYHTHRRNSFASSTPTVDAERVYVAWATPDQLAAYAFDHQGNQVWESKLGPFKSQHGFGVSPMLHEGMLILPNEQDGGGSLLALDCKTGKVQWKLDRQGKNATYSTPCVYKPSDKPAELIFTNWQHGITGVDPKNGKVLWELSVFEPKKPERAIASPVVAGDLVLGTCGFVTAQKHLVAVRPGDPQQGIKPQEVWRIEKAVAYLPTPLVKGEHIYLCSEKGIASCLEAATGKVIWQERLPGDFSASPVCAKDQIYCVSDDGDVFVIRAAPAYQVLGRSRLGEPSQSTPAIANDTIFFRTQSHLIAVGGKK